MSAFRLVVAFGKQMRTIGFDISESEGRSRASAASIPRASWPTRNCAPPTQAIYTADPSAARRGRHHHRRGAHAGRRGAHPRLPAACRRQRQRRPAHEEGRHRRLRVDGLSRRHRGGLHSGARARIGLQVEAGLLRRLLARAHQPGRQGAHAHEDPEDRLRRHAGDAGEGGRSSTRRSSSPASTGPPSIKAAEAAKVIENTQRDLNIALMNELAIIFDKLGIDTARGARGRRHQVELPQVQARPGRRPLHRRRPLLPDAQGARCSATTRR